MLRNGQKMGLFWLYCTVTNETSLATGVSYHYEHGAYHGLSNRIMPNKADMAIPPKIVFSFEFKNIPAHFTRFTSHLPIKYHNVILSDLMLPLLPPISYRFIFIMSSTIPSVYKPTPPPTPALLL